MTEGKEPLFLVSTEGKTEDEIADEVVEQLRALGIEVTDEDEDESAGDAD
jgi:hypothetical protein